MKIVIDISPLNSGHKVRGVGMYIKLLADNIEKFDKKNQYVFSKDPSRITKDIDLIHYPYFDPFFPTLPFMKRHKTVVTVHDIIPIVHKTHFPSGIRGGFIWQVQKRLLGFSDAILVDSYASEEDVINHVGIKKKKVHVAYLAADRAFRPLSLSSTDKKAFKKRMNLPDRFALYVGDVTWNKNLPRLIKALQEADIPLVMVGKALTDTDYDPRNPWNSDRNEVLSLIKDNSQFTRLGFVSSEDLVSLYNTAAFSCMPSLDEGFGLPVLEAMQSGCPVVTSRMGSLPEVGGDAVVYVDAYSVPDMTEAFSRLFSNEVQQAALMKKGLIQAEKFTVESMIQSIVSVYESL